MTVPSGGKVKVKARSVVASLAIGLWLAPGCNQAEGPGNSAPQPPPNPSPRADLGHPVEPKLPRPGEGEGAKDISNVEKDLRKDLASPVIKPDTTTTPAPPAAGTDAGKPGRP